jgi:murein DD-endopeptidase MepM/ murein hydrolase activator NlpD
MKRTFVIAGSILAGLILAYLIFAQVSQRLARYSEPEIVEVDSSEFHAPPPPKIFYGIVVDSMTVEEGVIKRNENLSEILSRYNISPQTIYEISRLPKDSFNVRRLQSQKPYTVIHENDSLKTAKAFIYHPNTIDFVILKFEDSVQVFNGKNKVDTIVEVTSGIIETSLYNCILESGGSPMLVNELSDVYAWEIDFFGLQKGDAFKVIYERFEVNGQDAGMGKIIASWFRHMNEPFYAVKYDQGEGDEYFDEVGNSLRKTFLKAPLKFSRISSRFSYGRMHPVLKIRRPHTGVDYAAPKGTPVVAVGDGTVIMAAYHGGGGNSVKIKHNSNYTTGYLHLSQYGKGIKKGVIVKQGQVIGYVGSTGIATGPHLDFRFWKNGQAVDPLKIDPPSANPISEDHKEPYNKIKDAMIQRLDSIPTPEFENIS